MPRGVYARTSYHNNINAVSHTGLKQTLATAQKRSLALKGRTRPQSEIQHASEGLKQHYTNNPNKFLGNNNPFYGQKHTEETLELLSAKRKALWQGKEYREATLQSIIKGRRKCYPFDSKLEQELAEALEKAKLTWEYQPSLGEYDFKVRVNGYWLWIEIAGCYWHGCPSCFNPLEKLESKLGVPYGGVRYLCLYPYDPDAYDKYYNAYFRLLKEKQCHKELAELEKQVKGYTKILCKLRGRKRVIVFWEHEINENGYEWCVKQIKGYFSESM